MSKRLIAAAILLGALTLSSLASCGQQQPQGTLQGTVTVGPIFPVERPGETRPVPPEVFKGRTVIIYDAGRTRQLQTLNLAQIGTTSRATYSVMLDPGTYTVDINHSGIDRSAEVPAKIEIKPGQAVTLDISIDTGIR
jgi:hypothetical protein